MTTAPSIARTIHFDNDSDFRNLATDDATPEQIARVLGLARRRNWHVEVTLTNGRVVAGLVTAFGPIARGLVVQPVDDTLDPSGPAVTIPESMVAAVAVS